MKKYLDIVPQIPPENLSMTAATPEADQLFKVHDESEKQYLPEDQAHSRKTEG